MLPTPLINIKNKGVDIHDVERTLIRARKYSLAATEQSNRKTLSVAKSEKRKKLKTR